MSFKKLTANFFLTIIISLPVSGQAVGSTEYKEAIILNPDTAPAIVMHLPEWESVLPNAVYARDVNLLKSVLGERPVLDLIDFAGGTEAVTAPYPAGKLLIIEYSTPQGSIAADAEFTENIGDEKTTVYRRIGNYNTFVFDAENRTDAEVLLDQVKYEKVVQWLGRNPYIISAERAFILTTSDIFVSIVFAIVIGMGIAVLTGLVTGFVFFSLRNRRRTGMPSFSDAGGMTRLNLDGFTPDSTSLTHLQTARKIRASIKNRQQTDSAELLRDDRDNWH